MSAVVIDFVSAVARMGGVRPLVGLPDADQRQPLLPAQEFTFWIGASGASYVHTVFKLADCPELPHANFILARRGADGRPQVLEVGRIDEHAPALDQAGFRHHAVLIGADEVHVHLLGSSAAQRHAIERDLSGSARLARERAAALS